MSNQSCFCGCERFRFKINAKMETERDVPEGIIPEPPQSLWYNICRNCNHSFGSHVNIIRSQQAE